MSIWSLSVPKVKVIHWPWSKSLRLNICELPFFNNHYADWSQIHVEPPWNGERKLVQIVRVTWPTWSSCPYMETIFKNLLLWNRKADDLETWYAEMSTRVLSCLFKCCPWVALALFDGKVKFGPLCFCMGKSLTMDFSESIVVYDIKIGRCNQLNEYMKLRVAKHRVIHWPFSKYLRSNIFKLLVLNNNWF